MARKAEYRDALIREFAENPLMLLAPDDGAFQYVQETVEPLKRYILKKYGIEIDIKCGYMDKKRDPNTGKVTIPPYILAKYAPYKLETQDVNNYWMFVLDDETSTGGTLKTADYVLVKEMALVWQNILAAVVHGRLAEGLKAFDTGWGKKEIKYAQMPKLRYINDTKKEMPLRLLFTTKSVHLPKAFPEQNKVLIGSLLRYAVKHIVGNTAQSSSPLASPVDKGKTKQRRNGGWRTWSEEDIRVLLDKKTGGPSVGTSHHAVFERSSLFSLDNSEQTPESNNSSSPVKDTSSGQNLLAKDGNLDLAGKIILVVDDEAFIRESLESFLESEGYIIFTAEDGQAALDILRKKISEGERIDLVITDWGMPRMGGIELCEHIREDTSLKNIPMILMSGFLCEETESNKNIFQGFLNDKLCAPGKIINTVRKVLETYSGQKVVGGLAQGGVLPLEEAGLPEQKTPEGLSILIKQLSSIRMKIRQAVHELINQLTVVEGRLRLMGKYLPQKDARIIADILFSLKYKINGLGDYIKEDEKKEIHPDVSSEPALIYFKKCLATTTDLVFHVAEDLERSLNSLGRALGSIEKVYIETEEEAKNHFNIILRILDRVRHIVRDSVLCISGAKYEGLKEETFNISVIIGEVIEEFKVSLKEQGVCVTTIITDNLLISVNKTLLQQVFFNLIKNAIDAFEGIGGEKNIYIRAEKNEEKVVVTVADTGPGIAPEILNKIFEPYFTTRGKKGTGLGLAIVKQIVEAYGGKIKIESELGKGATFTIRLPLASSPVDLVRKSSSSQVLGFTRTNEPANHRADSVSSPILEESRENREGCSENNYSGFVPVFSESQIVGIINDLTGRFIEVINGQEFNWSYAGEQVRCRLEVQLNKNRQYAVDVSIFPTEEESHIHTELVALNAFDRYISEGFKLGSFGLVEFRIVWYKGKITLLFQEMQPIDGYEKMIKENTSKVRKRYRRWTQEAVFKLIELAKEKTAIQSYRAISYDTMLSWFAQKRPTWIDYYGFLEKYPIEENIEYYYAVTSLDSNRLDEKGAYVKLAVLGEAEIISPSETKAKNSSPILVGGSEIKPGAENRNKLLYKIRSRLSLKAIERISKRYNNPNCFYSGVSVPTRAISMFTKDIKARILPFLATHYEVSFSKDLSGAKILIIGPGKNVFEIQDFIEDFPGIEEINITDAHGEFLKHRKLQLILETIIKEKNSLPRINIDIRNVMELHRVFRGKVDLVFDAHVFLNYFSEGHLRRAASEITKALKPGGVHISISSMMDDQVYSHEQDMVNVHYSEECSHISKEDWLYSWVRIKRMKGNAQAILRAKSDELSAKRASSPVDLVRESSSSQVLGFTRTNEPANPRADSVSSPVAQPKSNNPSITLEEESRELDELIARMSFGLLAWREEALEKLADMQVYYSENYKRKVAAILDQTFNRYESSLFLPGDCSATNSLAIEILYEMQAFDPLVIETLFAYADLEEKQKTTMQ
ncbi:MAG: ATP-binding protein, partial [Candidatus Omnitrophica bacterium]|nr:ATP-binding protein [Candidatus Omnitrophota bacterium]